MKPSPLVVVVEERVLHVKSRRERHFGLLSLVPSP